MAISHQEPASDMGPPSGDLSEHSASAPRGANPPSPATPAGIHHLRRRAWMVIVAGAVLLEIASLAPNLAANAQTCTLVLGFAILHDQIPAIVGNCMEDVHFDGVTGDGLQGTSNGLLVWRKNDNLTAFTDGNTTWLDGPFGLQTRLNSQRFFWEPNPDDLAIVPTPQAGNPCITAGTTLRVISSDAGAGNVFATFGLTNRLNVPCTFLGFVGAEQRDANDNPMPTNVVRNGRSFVNQPGPTLVTVPPGGSAQFLMHWTQVPSGNEATCPVSGSLAVILPDQFVPLSVPIAIRACNGGELDVTAVQPISG
jgi:hypothetical protein